MDSNLKRKASDSEDSNIQVKIDDFLKKSKQKQAQKTPIYYQRQQFK